MFVPAFAIISFSNYNLCSWTRALYIFNCRHINIHKPRSQLLVRVCPTNSTIEIPTRFAQFDDSLPIGIDARGVKVLSFIHYHDGIMLTTEIIKSDVDFKSYRYVLKFICNLDRFFKLNNGLRVMLISSLKAGEIPEPIPPELAVESDVDSESEECERDCSECADGDVANDKDGCPTELRKVFFGVF